MKLLFCCLDVSPSIVFAFSVIANILYCSTLWTENVPVVTDGSRHDNHYYRSLGLCIMAAIMIIMAIYSIFVYFSNGSLTTEAQRKYFTIVNIFLVVQIIFIIVFFFFVAIKWGFSITYFIEICLMYSWNHQLKNHAEGKSSGPLLD